jgi:hypothetical protein
MAESTDGKAKGSRSKASRAKSSDKSESTPTALEDAHHGTLGCPVALCPICLAVSAVQPLRPDVVEHLLKAGSEFLLAMRAVIDARGAEVDPKRDRSNAALLEKIDIG